MNQPKHDCCAPALTTTKLFAAWDEAKRALGQDANQAGQLAMRLIANGEKPALEQLGERLAWARERLAAALDRLEDAGLVTRDGHAITGAMGLTYLATDHAVVLAGRSLHTWCALDAVGIPAALGLDATIRSKTIHSARPIEIHVEAGEAEPTTPPVEILVTLPGADTTFIEEECPQIAFYDTGTAPARSDARVLSVSEAMRLGRRIWSDTP